jgi:hypothetical protein
MLFYAKADGDKSNQSHLHFPWSSKWPEDVETENAGTEAGCIDTRTLLVEAHSRQV